MKGPVVLKGSRTHDSGRDVLIRTPQTLPDGPTVMLRESANGSTVLRVECPCGRSFDVHLETEDEE